MSEQYGRSIGVETAREMNARHPRRGDEVLYLPNAHFRYLVDLVRAQISRYEDAAPLIRRRRNSSAKTKAADIAEVNSKIREAEHVLRHIIAPANRAR